MQKLQESCDSMIHEKLDIKILILYILSKLPAPIDMSTLSDLCRSDEDIGYFDFADCLSELLDSGNIQKTDEGYAVTEKGRRNAVEVSGSLPYSVRKNADKVMAPVEESACRIPTEAEALCRTAVAAMPKSTPSSGFRNPVSTLRKVALDLRPLTAPLMVFMPNIKSARHPSTITTSKNVILIRFLIANFVNRTQITILTCYVFPLFINVLTVLKQVVTYS